MTRFTTLAATALLGSALLAAPALAQTGSATGGATGGVTGGASGGAAGSTVVPPTGTELGGSGSASGGVGGAGMTGTNTDTTGAVNPQMDAEFDAATADFFTDDTRAEARSEEEITTAFNNLDAEQQNMVRERCDQVTMGGGAAGGTAAGGTAAGGTAAGGASGTMSDMAGWTTICASLPSE